LRDYSKVGFHASGSDLTNLPPEDLEDLFYADFEIVPVLWAHRPEPLPGLLNARVCPGHGRRILGRVSDSSGAVLAGVQVTLTHESTGVSSVATTNAGGDYGFPQVPVGTYRLEFDLAGFKKSVQRGVNVDLNQVVTANSVLQVGATKETVEVTSEAPLVDTTSTQLGAIMDARQVANLPLNTRDTYQLLQLQPGVMSTVGSSNNIVYGSDDAGAVSVNGGRGRSNNFSVNGGDANDLFANLPTVQPRPTALRSSA